MHEIKPPPQEILKRIPALWIGFYSDLHLISQKPSFGDPHQPLKFEPCRPKHLGEEIRVTNRQIKDYSKITY